MNRGGLCHFRKSKRAQTDTDYETWIEDIVTNTLNAFDTGDVRAVDLVVGVLGDVAHTLTAEGHDASEDGTGRGTPVVTGFSHSAGVDPQASSELFPTVMAGHDRMPSVQASSVRRLTPTECERLQGFPDGHTAERFDFKQQAVIPQADSARYKQMGNAVAVPVFAWVMARLVAAHTNALPAFEEGVA